jgi:hypothetical protein
VKLDEHRLMSLADEFERAELRSLPRGLAGSETAA